MPAWAEIWPPEPTSAVTDEVSFEVADPAVPPPPMAMATEVAMLRVESVLPEPAATVTSPVRAVTEPPLICAATVPFTVASADDQPTDAPK